MTSYSRTSLAQYNRMYNKNQSLRRRSLQFSEIIDFRSPGRSVSTILSRNSSARLKSLISWTSFGSSISQSSIESSISKLQRTRRKRRYHDSADISEHPSYNLLNFRYDLMCDKRYKESKKRYDNQFLRELNQIVLNKPTVLEEYFARIRLSYTTLWPPLHSNKEIDLFKQNFFKLSPKQKKRLDFLMTTNFSYD